MISDMSKIKISASKFKVKKFNDKGNFDLWQKTVKTLLVQQGLHKNLLKKLTNRYVRWGLGGVGSESNKHDPVIIHRWGHIQCDRWRNSYGFVIKVRNIVYDKESLQQAVLKKITIWATHEGSNNGVWVYELLQ